MNAHTLSGMADSPERVRPTRLSSDGFQRLKEGTYQARAGSVKVKVQPCGLFGVTHSRPP